MFSLLSHYALLSTISRFPNKFSFSILIPLFGTLWKLKFLFLFILESQPSTKHFVLHSDFRCWGENSIFVTQEEWIKIVRTQDIYFFKYFYWVYWQNNVKVPYGNVNKCIPLSAIIVGLHCGRWCRMVILNFQPGVLVLSGCYLRSIYVPGVLALSRSYLRYSYSWATSVSSLALIM